MINNVRDKKSKLASSQYGEIWYSFQDISDYKFLNISIISSTNIKTLRGSKLIFFDNVTEHVINSDTLEIESDFSNISNLYLTNIDFVIEGNDDKLITKKHFDKVNFHFNKKAISFNKA